MKRQSQPLQLNDLNIYMPMGRAPGLSRGWRIIWTLVFLALVVGSLVAVSGVIGPQL